MQDRQVALVRVEILLKLGHAARKVREAMLGYRGPRCSGRRKCSDGDPSGARRQILAGIHFRGLGGVPGLVCSRPPRDLAER